MATMQQFIKAHVLVIGMRGLGVEIAKNVILAGPRAVTVADAGQVDLGDLSAQFYLPESSVGRDRVSVCIEALRELNPYVEVTPHTGAITVDFLRQFTVVVMTCSTPEERVKINECCRAQSPAIKFIAAEVHGLFGFVFDDFGSAGHTIVDPDGEKPRAGWVRSIFPGATTEITFLEDFPYAFEVGDFVELSEVRGMVEINRRAPVRVLRAAKYTITIELDSTSFKPYDGHGGIVTQVKMPRALSHRSLVDCTRSPGQLMEVDFAKFGRAQLLHVAFCALASFQHAHMGALPELNNVSHANEVLDFARELASQREPAIDLKADGGEAIVRLLAYHARAELSPMTSIFGGIVAQEIVKITGKYVPLDQYLFFDALECLACEPGAYDATSGDLAPLGSRYDGQIAVFGRAFQRKLGELRYFIVGAGALGCEFLKGFAMMGVSCGAGGRLQITDMDRIEVSNLNRQFLFRNWNVGQSKSLAAAAAIKVMNPALNVEAHELPVGADTENFFNDAFWMELDGVTNALDNIKARLYVDTRCVQYKKPLLESGTLGTKANVQVVIPHVTESYGSSPDPPEKEVPQCTLHNFPYMIEHCIQLAREEFETSFVKATNDVLSFLTKGDEHLASAKHPHEQRLMLESISDMLGMAGKVSLGDCVSWARNKFESLFNHRIRTILSLLPADKKDEAGQAFWSGTKRVPVPIEFSADDPLHMDFMLAATNLRAFLFRVPGTRSLDEIRALLAGVVVKPYGGPGAVQAPLTDESAAGGGEKGAPASGSAGENAGADEDHVRIAELKASLPPAGSVSSEAFGAIVFEKDDDSNFHIDYMAAAANLRARNYRIDEADRHRIKMIAGRIIPALASTTAMTTGFVLLELYKLQQNAPLGKHKNGFFNLAMPLLAFSEPLPPKRMLTPGPKGEKYMPDGYTLWDRFEIEGDLTLSELMAWFRDKHNLEVSVVSLGDALLYASFMPAHKSRLGTRMSELFTSVCKGVITPTMRQLIVVVGCEDENGDEVDVPVTYIRFRP